MLRSRLSPILLALAVGTGMALTPALPAAAANGDRVNLAVLLVTDGGGTTGAFGAELASEGVPTVTVDLNNAARPTLTAAYLSDTVDGHPRAKYQAVILPNAAPAGLTAAELTALTSYEQRFGIRQIDSYVYPTTAVGLNPPDYSGPLDGAPATVTAAGLGDAFRYLHGPVTFEDNSPSVAESYGYLARPATGTTGFTPLVTAPVPGGSTSGSLVGAYTHDNRSELVLTFAYNGNQQQFRLLGQGMIDWVTKGVHLGLNRHYLSFHVDDVFLPDSRWDVANHCTPGEDCPTGVTTTDIRMTPADVTYAVNWQNSRHFTLNMVFNGGGSDDAVAATGSDPLATSFSSNASRFGWINHTYSHLYLGCVQDFTVLPWRCQTDPTTGQTLWVSQADIAAEIQRNITFAQQHHLPIRPKEVVTGEHSGMRILPQQPDDNPNLAAALAQTGVTWLASDASRDPGQRVIGAALTVPRHPVNVFYNAGHTAEEVSEYNWIYASAADGGSGLCDQHPDVLTCITPLNPATGYAGYIIPVDTRIAMSQLLANDPDPHYIHQSNLTEDRIAYPMIDSILTAYQQVMASNTPLVNPTETDAGTVLRQQKAWQAAAGSVSGYVQDGRVHVSAPAGVSVPVTVPAGTRYPGLLPPLLNGPLFGDSYAGERSAWVQDQSLTLVLPS
jgi:hypothetical protein